MEGTLAFFCQHYVVVALEEDLFDTVNALFDVLCCGQLRAFILHPKAQEFLESKKKKKRKNVCKTKKEACYHTPEKGIGHLK